jgi:Tol biopolymer transport system component
MNRTNLSALALFAVIANCTTVSAGDIAFIGQSIGGAPHIYLRDPGGALGQITSGPYGDSPFTWSKDGTKIAYAESQNGLGIYTISADGNNPRRLSPSPGQDFFPDWSPDGTKLVFNHMVAMPPPPALPITAIMTMNSADGSNRRLILFNGRSFLVEPRWSPDGSKIVFWGNLNTSTLQIYKMNSDGSNVQQLTNSGNSSADPHWSPDGTKISFGSDRNNGDVNIFVMNADGSNVHQLTNFIEPQESGDTDWSPDGSELAFEWDVGGNGQSNSNAFAQVWTMNSNGTNQMSTGQQCSAVGCSPRWQP